MAKRRIAKRLHRPREAGSLTTRQILAWADKFHDETGRWPNTNSGHRRLPLGEHWKHLDTNLRLGQRGLPRGWSLARLLAVHRKVRSGRCLPRLTISSILKWADEFHELHGAWPKATSGPVPNSPTPGDTWRHVDVALYVGRRGLPGGSSLGRLLAKRRNVRSRRIAPKLTIAQILKWCDVFYATKGKWPLNTSGRDTLPKGESWSAIETILRTGGRGLAGGSSLKQLLVERRGARNKRALPPLTISQVLSWADAHFKRTGSWPTKNSGLIPEATAPGEAWRHVDFALRLGIRGLSAKGTLRQLLAKTRLD